MRTYVRSSLRAAALLLFVAHLAVAQDATVKSPSDSPAAGIQVLNANLNAQVPSTPTPAPSPTLVLSSGKAIGITQTPEVVWNIVQPTLRSTKQVLNVAATAYIPAKTPVFAHLEGDPYGKLHTFATDAILIYSNGMWPDPTTSPEEAALPSLFVIVQKLKVTKSGAELIEQKIIEILPPGIKPKPGPGPNPVTPVTPPVTPTPSGGIDQAKLAAWRTALDRDLTAITSDGRPAVTKEHVNKLGVVYASTAMILEGGSGDPNIKPLTTWKEVVEAMGQASRAKDIPPLPLLSNLRAEIDKMVGRKLDSERMTEATRASSAKTFREVSKLLLELSK